MMNVDPAFEARLAKRMLDIFPSVEVPYSGGAFDLATRNVHAGGKLFRSALLAPPRIEYVIGENDRSLESPAVSIEIDNLKGRMPDGSRFSDHVDSKFQSRFVSVYANLVGDFGILRELMFVGVPRGKPLRDEEKASITLVPLSEHFLSGYVLRIVRPDHYPHARESDIGRPIPWVVAGTVKHVDGIMRRSRQASMPVPHEDNEGDATLDRPNISQKTFGGTWTVTAQDPQPTIYEGSPGSFMQPLGDRFDNEIEPNYWVYGVAFTPTQTGRISGFSMYFKTSAGFDAADVVFKERFTGYRIYGALMSFIGEPVFAANARSATISALDNQTVEVFFPVGGQVLAGSKRVVAVRGFGPIIQEGVSTGISGGFGLLGVVSEPEAAALGYEFWFGQYAPNPDFPDTFLSSLSIKYDIAMFNNYFQPWPVTSNWVNDAEQGNRLPPFKIHWNEASPEGVIWNRYVPYFKVEHNGQTKFGVYDEIFEWDVTGGSAITIKPEHWSGTPVHGDSWTFTTPSHHAEIVLAESRADSRVTAMQNIVVEGQDDDGKFWSKHFSEWDGEGPVAMIRTLKEIREDWRVSADLTASGSTNAGEVMLRTIRRAGVPDQYIDVPFWTQTIATLAGLSWNFGGMVNDAAKNYQAVLLDMAFQCRCRFEWIRDKARLRFLVDPGTEAILDTVTVSDLFVVTPFGPAKPDHRLEQTDATRTVNKVVIRYNRNWSLDSSANGYLGIKEAKNPQAILDFGERPNDDEYTCDFIVTGAVAQNLANFERDRKAYPEDDYFATVRMPWSLYEPGDGFDVDVP